MNKFLCTTTFLVWILTISAGFVLISSANDEIDIQKTFEPGTSLTYEWRSNVLLDEDVGNNGSRKNVGFSLSGVVVVDTVWSSADQGERVVKIKLESPQLHIKSRRAQNDFVPHTSSLDNFKNHKFLLKWNKGNIEKILMEEKENTALKNIKKGIASLFQVQSNSGHSSEIDASGHCKVDYKITSPTSITKEKSNCESDEFQNKKFFDDVLGLDVNSKRNVMYQLDTLSKVINVFLSREEHLLRSKSNQNFQAVVETEQILRLKEVNKCKIITANSLEDVVNRIAKQEKLKFIQESLKTEKELLDDAKIKFSKEVDGQRTNLKSESLGYVKSAKAFISLVNSAKFAKEEDIFKTLSSKKNVKILEQILDVLGYTQTKDSHSAVMKILHLDSEEKTDSVERYLWALSLSPHPNVDIVEDLLIKYKKYSSIPTKIKHTLILSVASMARAVNKFSDIKDHDTQKILNTVEETIVNDLDYSKGEEKTVYFGALRNLQFATTVPTLIKYIKEGSQKEEMLAWKTVRSFNKSLWSKDLLKLADKTAFQLDKKHDSSARTLAVDVILQSDVSQEKLKDLLKFIVSNETNYEVKQYVFQSIKMLADKDETFNKMVEQIVKHDPYLNNYSARAPRGISTALRRSIFNNPSVNGSLVSVQEIKNGVVKRGDVDIALDKDDGIKELFKLGLFTNGLTSFISSDEPEENAGEEENTTAGMELTVLGTQIRPFVFFDGQGELMGHVWSGTASEMTNAFQANILLQDHTEIIRLGNGFLAEIDLKGAVSFDLSGKIEISLWNRNAESLIEKSAGYLVNGLIKVDSSIVKSMIDFNASIEPKLILQMDADFSSGVKLCMRLQQPDTIFRHNIHKTEKIPNSRHKIRISKYIKSTATGRTYALNRKNNEMCSAIFS